MKKQTAKKIASAPKLKITDPVVLELWTKAGGRCEFHGCNEYLLQDALTTNELKLGDIAHIVARSKDGPRGDDPLPLSERNKVDNLMLSCLKHHRMIDNKKLVKKYPKELLTKYKTDHEARIRHLTSIKPDHETVVLRVLGNIRGDSISISHNEICAAVLDAGKYPRYLQGDNSIEINLQQLSQKIDSSYWTAATSAVKDFADRIIAPSISKSKIEHLSIFALARIPVLVYLGNAIGDKVATDFYQHHRDEPADWRWRQGKSLTFKTHQIQKGCNEKCVAIIISLSGKISKDSLPENIDNKYYIYEIIPIGVEPGRSILQTIGSLKSFQQEYQSTLRHIEKIHGSQSDLHMFAAIPAPIAIICGRELLKNVSPKMHIYDKTEKGYELAITIS